MSFEWKRLCVRYKSEKGEKVSGPQSASCAAGSVNAILANDSNLAEALLQTMAYSQSDLGELLLNGHPRPRDWKYRFAFVPNTDTLSGKLTVEEHLKLAVSQRCWQGTTSARRKEIVNELIAYFELEEVRKRRLLRLGTPDSLSLLVRRTLMLGS
jgi:ABC-type cobalamin/Fe3+-siderophores transport system ATPase subunit